MVTTNNIKPLIRDSYLIAIKNSVGSQIFKNLYAEVEGKRKDILNNGMYSCVWYVSNILLMCRLLKENCTTVGSIEKNMIEIGWYKIKKPKVGCVIFWAEFDVGDSDPHRHIGFYIGNGKAVSTDYKTGKPHIHRYNLRPIEKNYWHKKIS